MMMMMMMMILCGWRDVKIEKLILLSIKPNSFESNQDFFFLLLFFFFFFFFFFPGSVQYCSRWYLCVWKAHNYVFHPVSQKFPQRCLQTIPLRAHVWLTMPLSRLFKEDSTLGGSIQCWRAYFDCMLIPWSAQYHFANLTDSADAWDLQGAISVNRWMDIMRMSLQWLNQVPQNQHARELISAGKTSHKHNSKDLSRLPGTRVNTRYINSILEGVYVIVFTRMPGETYTEDVPLVAFVYLVCTRMPGESYRGYSDLCCVCVTYFRALINSLVCWFCTSALGLVLFRFVSSTAQFGARVPKSEAWGVLE